MKTRTLHKVIGLTLFLPFMAWIITALVFYFKPGYAGAYESLQVKTYPLSGQFLTTADTSWLEVRHSRTILGNHLAIRTAKGWMQLDPVTLQPRVHPTTDEIRTLLTDAFSVNPERYGQVATISNDTVITTTGVLILLDWDRLSLYQRGPDTDRIDLLYRIHYLQWSGIESIDKILGPLGFTLVLALSILGVRLAVRRKGESGLK